MSGIQNIPNQPIQIDPPIYDGCDFTAERCLVIHKGDPMSYTQVKLNPCFPCIVPQQNATSPQWIQDLDTTGVKFCAENTLDQIDFWYQPSQGFEDIGNYFHIVVHVTNVIAGTIRVTFGNNVICDAIADNTYDVYLPITPSIVNTIQFIPMNTGVSLFTGCVEVECVDAYFIPDAVNDWVQIVDIKTQEVQTQAPLAVNVYKDHLIIGWEVNYLDEVCYQLRIADPCYLSGLYTSPIISYELDDTEGWVDANDCVYGGCNYPLTVNQVNSFCGSSFGDLFMGVFNPSGVTANKIEQTWTKSGIGLPQPPTDCCYRVRFPIHSVGFNPNTTYRNLTVKNGKAGGCEWNSGSGLVTYSGEYVTFDCCEAIDELYIRYELDYPNVGTYFVESVCIGKIDIIEICQNDPALWYHTNCFQVLPLNTNDGTKLITGESLTNTFQLGFYFAIGFVLQQRLFVKALAPKYPIDSSSYIFSDGTKKLTSAQREKVYDVTFRELTEIQHDTLSAQILTKEFKIDNKEYYVDPKDYQPNWNAKYGYPMADVRIEAMEQGTIIFKSNEN